MSGTAHDAAEDFLAEVGFAGPKRGRGPGDRTVAQAAATISAQTRRQAPRIPGDAGEPPEREVEQAEQPAAVATAAVLEPETKVPEPEPGAADELDQVDDLSSVDELDEAPRVAPLDFKVCESCGHELDDGERCHHCVAASTPRTAPRRAARASRPGLTIGDGRLWRSRRAPATVAHGTLAVPSSPLEDDVDVDATVPPAEAAAPARARDRRQLGRRAGVAWASWPRLTLSAQVARTLRRVAAVTVIAAAIAALAVVLLGSSSHRAARVAPASSDAVVNAPAAGAGGSLQKAAQSTQDRRQRAAERRRAQARAERARHRKAARARAAQRERRQARRRPRARATAAAPPPAPAPAPAPAPSSSYAPPVPAPSYTPPAPSAPAPAPSSSSSSSPGFTGEFVP